jgi:hypothetical protein
LEHGSRWWIVLFVAVTVSVLGTSAALAHKAPTQGRADPATDPAVAPGLVTPLAVNTFGGKASRWTAPTTGRTWPMS